MNENEKQSGYALKDDYVEEALVTGEHRDLLEAYFGEQAYEDLQILATRARSAKTRGGPRVLILPGIMGSKLGKRKARLFFDDTIWIDPADIIAGNLRQLSLVDGRKDIKPLGVILFAYLKLKLRLKQAGFDADFYPFDWRQSIPVLGKELADQVRKETGQKSGRQHLYLVAHSMGGLVSRAGLKILKEKGEDHKVRRLVMLGTPNFGSFAPVQALMGSYMIIKRIAALDLGNSLKDLVNKVFNTFPGLYQMMPAPLKFSGLDLYNAANWPGIGMGPRSDLLPEAPKVHETLIPGNDLFTLIAGINQETVVNIRREGNGFVYSISMEGDGTVPLVYAQLDGVNTYFVEEEHGSLPNNADVSRAVIDLIETSRTNVLPATWSPRMRGIMREVRSEDILMEEPYGGRRGEQISPREIRQIFRELMAPPVRFREESPPAPAGGFAKLTSESIVIGRKRQRRIDIRLAHGSVTQVDSRAIVLGLFKGVTPSGAAGAIDEQLGGIITDFTERRMIAANMGEVFIMPANRYRMGVDMVVFAGLGTFDDFNEEVLRIAAENVARALARTKIDDFATVLMSTGIGMPVGAVLANLLQGFLRGLAEGDQDGHLRSITLCEADQERFMQMHAELLRLTTTSLFDDLETTVAIRKLPPVPPSGYIDADRGHGHVEDPVYLIVRELIDTREKETDIQLNADFTLRASVLTAGQKATVITDAIDIDGAQLIAHLEQIEQQSFNMGSLDKFGHELAQLVLPPLIRKVLPGMKGRRIMIIHDARTSWIPWETICIDKWYPSAEMGLSRKYEADNLSVAGWLEERRLAEKLRVLLIVNPTEDLPGAESEGKRIQALLSSDPVFQIDTLWREEATWSAVRAGFRSGDFDVIHYAGHAFFDPHRRSRSGIVCHGKQVLSGLDLVNIEKLPALVFFNACEAARIRKSELPENQEPIDPVAKRLERNIGLAESLLRAGVGNYVGTYWPVGDDPAEQFAAVFYKTLAHGHAIGEALQEGRKRVMELKSVDWADYIHYGSPSFVVKRKK